MSFLCEMDRSFLFAINRVEDDLPIGRSDWLIIDRSQESLDTVAQHILNALPHAGVSILKSDFGEWGGGSMVELQTLGVI
jgi:hypothetical protein